MNRKPLRRFRPGIFLLLALGLLGGCAATDSEDREPLGPPGADGLVEVGDEPTRAPEIVVLRAF